MQTSNNKLLPMPWGSKCFLPNGKPSGHEVWVCSAAEPHGCLRGKRGKLSGGFASVPARQRQGDADQAHVPCRPDLGAAPSCQPQHSFTFVSSRPCYWKALPVRSSRLCCTKCWAAHCHPNNQRAPGPAVRCKPKSWHQSRVLLWVSYLDGVERSNSHLGGHPVASICYFQGSGT